MELLLLLILSSIFWEQQQTQDTDTFIWNVTTLSVSAGFRWILCREARDSQSYRVEKAKLRKQFAPSHTSIQHVRHNTLYVSVCAQWINCRNTSSAYTHTHTCPPHTYTHSPHTHTHSGSRWMQVMDSVPGIVIDQVTRAYWSLWWAHRNSHSVSLTHTPPHTHRHAH